MSQTAASVTPLVHLAPLPPVVGGSGAGLGAGPGAGPRAGPGAGAEPSQTVQTDAYAGSHDTLWHHSSETSVRSPSARHSQGPSPFVVGRGVAVSAFAVGHGVATSAAVGRGVGFGRHGRRVAAVGRDRDVRAPDEDLVFLVRVPVRYNQ